LVSEGVSDLSEIRIRLNEEEREAFRKEAGAAFGQDTHHGELQKAGREAVLQWTAKRRGQPTKKVAEPDGLGDAMETLRLLAKDHPGSYESAIGIIQVLKKAARRAGSQSKG
jgi:hypothetical protein